MKVRRMRLRTPWIVACLFVLIWGTLSGGTRAADVDPAAVQQLSTVGLSDFQQVKLFELCLDYDELKQGIAGNPRAEIVVEIGLIDVPDLDLRATRGKWSIGPMEFVSDFGRICISNLDVKVDVTDGDGDGFQVDRTGLDDKLEAIKDALLSEPGTVELEPSDVDEDEGRDARKVLDRIRANNGLLPEFTIRIHYTLRRLNDSKVLDQQLISLVNTNPPPIRVLAPTGSELRPTLRFQVPSVPAGIAYLENEYWIEDEDGRNVWEGQVAGGTVKVRYTPSDYGKVVQHTYPGVAPSLVPGRNYTIVSKLRDPYGVEVDPDRLVGVRHDPEGERFAYRIAVRPIELVAPGDVAPAKPVFEWNDPNSSEVRGSVWRYQLNAAGRSHIVSGTRFEVPYLLAEGQRYTWQVVALDRGGNPIPGTMSEERSFTVSAAPGAGPDDSGRRDVSGPKPDRQEDSAGDPERGIEPDPKELEEMQKALLERLSKRLKSSDAPEEELGPQEESGDPLIELINQFEKEVKAEYEQWLNEERMKQGSSMEQFLAFLGALPDLDESSLGKDDWAGKYVKAIIEQLGVNRDQDYRAATKEELLGAAFAPVVGYIKAISGGTAVQIGPNEVYTATDLIGKQVSLRDGQQVVLSIVASVPLVHTATVVHISEDGSTREVTLSAPGTYVMTKECVRTPSGCV